MLLTLTYIFWSVLSPTDGFTCNVTKDDKTAVTYYIITFENNCYLFGKEKQAYDNAYNFCSRNKGVLTDVYENFESLIKETLNESTRLEANYWIGLFWTDIWKSYIWASGTYYIQPRNFDPDSFGSCVTYVTSAKRFENVACTNVFAPICMFKLKEDVTTNDTSGCAYVCDIVRSSYGRATTTVTTTSVTTDSSHGRDNTTESPPSTTATQGNFTSKTCMCTGCDVTSKTCLCTGCDVTSKTCNCTDCDVTCTTCNCTECPCDSQHEAPAETPLVRHEESLTNMTSLAVLAALLSASLLVNVTAFVVLCRVRCQNDSGMEPHKHVPMVDILNVDTQSLNQATRYNNQETRVGYDIYADPDGETPGYQEMDIKMSVAKQIKTDQSKEVTSDHDSQPYSHLNRDGAQPTKSSETDRVYGPDSVMAATSISNEALSPSSRHENSADGNNLYSNYDSSL